MIDVAKDLDHFKGINIEINRKAKDLRSVSLKEAEYSKSFTVPVSARNDAAFSYYANIDVDSTQDPHQAIPAYWTFDLSTRFVGVLELKGSIYKNGKPYAYSLVFYGRLKNLATVFGNDKLTDVDWSVYDHALNFGNILNSWTGDLSPEDIMYPLVDTHENWYFGPTGSNQLGNIRNETNGIKLADFIPAIRFRAMIKHIFSQYGLVLSGTIDDQEFDSLYILPKNKSGANFDYEAFNQNDVYVGLSSNQFVDSTTPVDLELDDETQDDNDNWNSATYTFTAFAEGIYSWNKSIIAVASDVLQLHVDVLIDGVPSSIDFTFTDTNLSLSAQVFVSQPFDIFLEEGQTMKLQVSKATGFSNDISIASFNLMLTDFPTIIANDTSQLINTMPDDKIIDFLNGIMKAMRWVVVPGSYQGQWRMLSETDWLSEGVERDWSKYVDLKNATFEKTKVYKNIKLRPAESETAAQTAFEQETLRRFGEVNIQANVEFGQEKFEVEAPFTFWIPQIFNVLDENNAVVDQITPSIYKMLDIEGSPSKDKWLMFYNNSVIGTLPYEYYVQSGLTGGGSPVYTTLGKYPICNFHNGDLSPNVSSAVSCYSVESTLAGFTPLNTIYKRYWEEALYNLYAPGARVAKIQFLLPKSEFLSYELNDRIFAEGRWWIIDEIKYDTDSEITTAVLRSYNPINKRGKVKSIDAGGKADLSGISPGAPDSFVITSSNLVRRGSNWYLNSVKGNILSNPIRYTEAKVQNIDNYINNIINGVSGCIRSWTDDWDCCLSDLSSCDLSES